MIQKTGNLNIGLSYYQECEWLSAIKHYGESIMNKSLLSPEQKAALIANAK
jgi:hypothetical protein